MIRETTIMDAGKSCCQFVADEVTPLALAPELNLPLLGLPHSNDWHLAYV